MSAKYIPALGYSVLTSFYDPVVKATTRETQFKRALVNRANIHSGLNVLDVGCGTGTLAIAAARSVPDATIVGLDGDPKILAIAANKARHGDAQVRFVQNLATQMPYADESFDRVLSSLFFHHLSREDKLSTLSEIFRVLIPGGELHVADWGKPTGKLARCQFFFIQLLDGFKTTRDNVHGKLPDYFRQAGFFAATLEKEISTVFGTMSLYSAVKPRDAA
ncbi:MAG: class I SAM-dependent methyltransferase [Pseudomonadales bacterium]